MTTLAGYSLIEIATGNEVGSATKLPAVFPVGITQTHFDAINQVSPSVGSPTHKLVERHKLDAPNRFHLPTVDTLSFDGVKTIVDPHYSPMTVAAAKSIVKKEIEDAADLLLAPSSRRQLRDISEPGKPLPAATKNYRRDVNAQSDVLIAEIDAMSTLAQIAAFVPHDWPTPV